MWWTTSLFKIICPFTDHSMSFYLKFTSNFWNISHNLINRHNYSVFVFCVYLDIFCNRSNMKIHTNLDFMLKNLHNYKLYKSKSTIVRKQCVVELIDCLSNSLSNLSSRVSWQIISVTCLVSCKTNKKWGSWTIFT